MLSNQFQPNSQLLRPPISTTSKSPWRLQVLVPRLLPTASRSCAAAAELLKVQTALQHAAAPSSLLLLRGGVPESTLQSILRSLSPEDKAKAESALSSTPKKGGGYDLDAFLKVALATPAPSAPQPVATPFKLLPTPKTDADAALAACATLSRSDRVALASKDQLRIQHHISGAPLPVDAEGKSLGLDGRTLSELARHTDPSVVLYKTADVLEILEDISKHLEPYHTGEVFKIVKYDTTQSPPVPLKVVDLFSEWHECTPEDVVAYIKLTVEHTDDVTIAQDLKWSHPCIKSAITDPDLRKTAMAAALSYPKFAQKTGPLLLKLALDQITTCSEESLMAIRTRLYSFKLGDIPGSNVTQYNSIMVQVSAFLSVRRIDVSEAIYQVLKQYALVDNNEFCSHFGVLKSIQSPLITTLSSVTNEGRRLYDDIVTRGTWGITTKPVSAFPATSPPAAGCCCWSHSLGCVGSPDQAYP